MGQIAEWEVIRDQWRRVADLDSNVAPRDHRDSGGIGLREELALQGIVRGFGSGRIFSATWAALVKMEFLLQEIENLAFRECEESPAILAGVFLLRHQRDRVSQAIRRQGVKIEFEWFFAHIR